MHLKSIASYIRAANADMIVLAEVQDCDVGNMLLQEIGDPTLRFYLVPGEEVRASRLQNECIQAACGTPKMRASFVS